MNYAYARVSAKDQNLQRQIAAFSEFGIEKSRIFSEKKSGKDFERTEYKRLLKKLNCGDLLVIKSIDRIGAQLQSDNRRMEQNYKRNRRGHTRVGYAAARHPHESGYFGRKVHFGYCVASIVFRSRE